MNNGTGSQLDHWTDNVRFKKRFVQELRRAHPLGFSNGDAYQIYFEGHKERRDPRYYHNEENDPWYQMNVRNQLCMLEHRGVLIRVRPGTYVWRIKRHWRPLATVLQ